jgi:hypothetical protein
LGGPPGQFHTAQLVPAPPDWNADLQTALYLPLGESLDFSHPEAFAEALTYIDGQPYSGCDRHHRLALHGRLDR